MLICISGCDKKIINSNYENKNIDYYGYLVIPDINMKLGFYNYNHLFNDVNKNIELINTNIEDTYVLAGHSGSSYFALFNDLKYIEEGDTLYLELSNVTKKYKVVYIKKELKDGNINIPNESGWLILTTCDQNEKGYQLIIAGKLV